jgi:hypothetical protein
LPRRVRYSCFVPTPCSTCSVLERHDALAIDTVEIVATIHNACAPVTHYVARCRTCEVRWLVIEVYDEDGVRPSEWSWSVAAEDAPPAD